MTNLFIFFDAKKSSMTHHNVHLTKYQESRVAKGHKVRLTHEQLLGGPHKLHLKPRKLKKLQTAIRNHRGAEIHLEPDEACEVGGSILGLYEKHVKPHVRGFLHKQAARFLPHAQHAAQEHLSGVLGHTGARRVASAIAPIAHHAINRVGDATGAYGLAHRRHMKRAHALSALARTHGGSLKSFGRELLRVAKPLIRPGLKSIATAGLAYAGAPELVPGANMAIDAAGNAYGFGLGHAGGARGGARGTSHSVTSARPVVAVRGRGFGRALSSARSVSHSIVSGRPLIATRGKGFRAAGY